jgi:hypothetical protein
LTPARDADGEWQQIPKKLFSRRFPRRRTTFHPAPAASRVGAGPRATAAIPRRVVGVASIEPRVMKDRPAPKRAGNKVTVFCGSLTREANVPRYRDDDEEEENQDDERQTAGRQDDRQEPPERTLAKAIDF